MQKPKMKQEVKVTSSEKDDRRIYFFATPEFVTDFESFGTIRVTGSVDGYVLYVDPRFDFDEVLEYIQSQEN